MKLIAGHDTIEFGWLVSTWVPYLRHIKYQFEKLVVVCNPINRYLYEDFADDFVDYVDHNCVPDMYYAGVRKKAQVPYSILDRKEFEGFYYKHPAKRFCEKSKKKFFKYGQINKGTDYYDIVIHARAEDKYHQGKLNYNPDNYAKIVKEFKGLKICSVGLVSKAYHIEGTDDMRGVFMKYLCVLLSNSKVIVGTSSGPLHLASHCCCPQVVLTNNKSLKSLCGRNNRFRYERLWNPFNTPVTVLDEDNWHPPVEKVINAIRSYV